MAFLDDASGAATDECDGTDVSSFGRSHDDDLQSANRRVIGATCLEIIPGAEREAAN
jgi:hypothetical protein